MIWKVLLKIKNCGGILGFIKFLLKKISYREAFQDELDTLFFFLNSFMGISNVPAATGRLRNLQHCDAELLRLFHQICMATGWRYWLDYGTLLGAVRHQGFIPWDDDLDVGMPREDYDDACERLSIIASEISPKLYVLVNEGINCLGMGIRGTGIWMDIFPYDSCEIVPGTEQEHNLQYEITKASALFSYGAITQEKKAQYYSNHFTYNSAINGARGKNTKQGKVWFVSPFTRVADKKLYCNDVLFPLVPIEFEGISLFVPQQYKQFLKIEFGEDYMHFPRSGVLHHEIGSNSLDAVAEINGIKMNELLFEMKKMTYR